MRAPRWIPVSPALIGRPDEVQYAILLHRMLFAGVLAGVLLALNNLALHDVRETTAFMLLTAACVAGLYLNSGGHYAAAARLLCGATLLIIDFILFDASGLHDTGVAAFPIFILCAAFLFDRRGVWWATALALLSVAGLYLLQVGGYDHPSNPARPLTVLVLSIILLLFGMVAGGVRYAWDRHLSLLDETYDLTLRGWARALEYRDGETEGHSQRVTRLCVDLARRLGQSEAEIVNIQRGAYLHDIGKMAIPDRVLYKPGPLDPEERAIMQRHPVLALQMLADIHFLRPALTIPRAHHEYWDGSGYPEGLRGEAIPMAARIFTVVDHWDALLSDRPYRKAWDMERVATYLRDNSGKLYDPRVVIAFLDMVQPGRGPA